MIVIKTGYFTRTVEEFIRVLQTRNIPDRFLLIDDSIISASVTKNAEETTVPVPIPLDARLLIVLRPQVLTRFLEGASIEDLANTTPRTVNFARAKGKGKAKSHTRAARGSSSHLN